MTDGNVIDLAGKKKKKNKNPDRMSKPLVYLMIAHAIDRKPSPLKLPRFPQSYYSSALAEGQRLVLRDIGDGVVIVSSRDAVAEDILNYVMTLGEEFALDWRGCQAAADYWMREAPALPQPPHFRWLSDPGLTFNRLPWEQGVIGKTPTWDGLLARMSNADAFRQWIGSLFVPEANHQQYVWLMGQGGEGKGSIDRFLHRVMGYGYRSEEPPQNSDRFWTYFLIGARLVTFADCNAKGFPASGRFKSLCANDAVRCEEKGGRCFTTRLGARFAFYSNERPSLSTERADMRRIIYCELEEHGAAIDPHFEAKLWEEGGAFIAACLAAYHQACPQHGPILAETETIRAWVGSIEANLQDIFEENFKVILDSAKREHEQVFETPKRVAEVLRGWAKDKKTRDEFYSYIFRSYGIRNKLVRVPGLGNNPDKFEHRYVGLQIKPRNW